MHSFFANIAGENLDLLRKEKPLIHNITNFVVMNVTANALLALGASPVMAHAIEEVEEVTRASSALVINIGSIDSFFAKSMYCALDAACAITLPVVIDPVGVGISALRYEVASTLLKQAKNGFTNNRPSHTFEKVRKDAHHTIIPCTSFALEDENILPYIIRGNASEIIVLGQKCTATNDSNFFGKSKGVDSTEQASTALPFAKRLSATYNCVVSISGATDYIVSPKGKVVTVKGGSHLMPKVTGMGCVATAITAACAAVAKTPFMAAVSAMVFMATAGSLAAKKTEAPGSFFPFFIDALYTMQTDALFTQCQIEME